MLSILINNTSLDVDNVKFNIVQKAPLDLENTIEGSYIFNFRIPGTDHNHSTFGHPYRLTKFELQNTSYPGRVTFNGRSFAEGTFRVTQAGKKSIEIRMAVNSGAYNSLIKNIKLPEIFDKTVDLGLTSQAVIDHAKSKRELQYPDTDYNFPVIYNPDFYGDLNPDFQCYVNRWNYFQDNFFLNEIRDPRTYPELDNTDCLSPQLYLFYVLKKCFSAFGYQVSGKPLNDSELSTLLLYNNFALDERQQFYFAHADLSANQGPETGSATVIFDNEVQDPDNCYNPSNGKYTLQEKGYYSIRTKLSVAHLNNNCDYEVHVKIMKGTEVVQQEDYTGYGITNAHFDIEHEEYFTATGLGDLSIKVEVSDYIDSQWVDGSFNVLAGADFIIEDISGSNLNRYAKTIEYKNHVPDKKISEFLTSIFKVFGVIPFFDHSMKTVELVFLKDLVSHPDYVNYSDNITKNSIRVDSNDYEGISLGWDWDGQDDFLKDNLKDISNYTLLGTYDSVFERPKVPGELNVLARINNSKKYTIWSLVDVEIEDPQNPGEFITVKKTKWVEFSDDFYEYTLDDGKKEITPGITPLTMEFSDSHGFGLENSNRTWLAPRCKQKGTSPAFETGVNDPGLRLIFYRGMQPLCLSSDGTIDLDSYPMASFGRMTVSGDFISNTDYQLTWEGDHGLVAKFWQPVIDWLKRRLPIELQRQLSPADIEQLVLNNKFRLQEIFALFKEVSIPVSNREIGQAKIKGYTV